MKSVLIASAALALAWSAVPSAAMAANAKTPYQNVNRTNDAGNDTGDSRVDALNSAQLDQNYKGPYYTYTPGAAPPASATPSATQVTDEAPPPPARSTARRPMRRPAPRTATPQ